MGAVPFQEAKWPRLGKRPMSPMSPSSRAAPDGPMPLRSSRPLPVAATSFGQLACRCLDLLVDRRRARRSARRPAGGGSARRRPRGRTVSSSARAWVADRNFFAPPGISSSSSWCSRLTVSVRAPAQLVTAVDQQPQRDRSSSTVDLTQAGGAQRRPRRRGARRPGRSCGPGRWRTPAPARTASPARRARSRRRRPGAGRRAGRCRCSPRPPRPAAATGGRPRASPVAVAVGAEPAPPSTCSRLSITSIVAESQALRPVHGITSRGTRPTDPSRSAPDCGPRSKRRLARS